ncbi:hypothetical protein CKO28_03190 [Rhodovibrio sodomensis]|uniref:RES domain-containing protein n=1 Tax=Rhodovibrio sodomensis TaxID=1088 RepID=A0ABS1D9Z9_9PROT|nr:hypothetical protein [Rhodovibrio sodomensis]MBK1667049.1 hypothetical protein [Rhodovibrio sodomensis]
MYQLTTFPSGPAREASDLIDLALAQTAPLDLRGSCLTPTMRYGAERTTLYSAYARGRDHASFADGTPLYVGHDRTLAEALCRLHAHYQSADTPLTRLDEPRLTRTLRPVGIEARCRLRGYRLRFTARPSLFALFAPCGSEILHTDLIQTAELIATAHSEGRRLEARGLPAECPDAAHLRGAFPNPLRTLPA